MDVLKLKLKGFCDMIILITYIDPETNVKTVSHGVNIINGQTIVIPNLPLSYYNWMWDLEIGEYVLA